MNRNPKSRNLKTWIPYLFMATGAALLLAFGLYTATHYPWRAFLARQGLAEMPELPDPAPISASIANPIPLDPESAARTDAQDLLPGQPDPENGSAPATLTALGVIKIPKIELSENIVEGSDQELYYAVGHVSGSAMPGQPGNCVLAGHRNYIPMRPFRYLDLVETGDVISLSDGLNRYQYEVFRIVEITPEETWVLDLQDGEDSMLTLITCTPVIGMHNRLVVFARLTDSVTI